MKLRSLETVRSKSRISSVDIFRAIAIISVVIYHFNGFLPFGYLGVDLFFVISGLLVGSILIRKFKKNEKINFWKFILQRGFKIWPSYYWFLVFGTLLAYLFYSADRPDFYISSAKDSLRYVFFFQNYTAGAFHWPFDHVWSLCIEEHFYILFPIMLICVMFLFGNNRSMLILSVAGLIIAGIFFKLLSFYLSSGVDAFTVTQKRIDGLGWGVILAILVTYYEEWLRRSKQLVYMFILGVILFSCSIYLCADHNTVRYQGVVLYSLTPFCFFLMLLGLYFVDFSKWTSLRFVSYYSYNWYLWHPIFVLLCGKYFGVNGLGLVIYLAASFFTAMLFTILIEERFLRMREPVLSRIFRSTKEQEQATMAGRDNK